uniref:Uncharacterized protein n=1 Tax=Rhizochromulina marina TaxID=1034831 RepID=A0A7S2RH25_9STRA|mmetsp:Transcript_16189/g.47532  ORF Transcript_16189/g.47532 Transcript_16189/m.47532 type:complete len:632 (+) Transcript_16189:81-1976(+)
MFSLLTSPFSTEDVADAVEPVVSSVPGDKKKRRRRPKRGKARETRESPERVGTGQTLEQPVDSLVNQIMQKGYSMREVQEAIAVMFNEGLSYDDPEDLEGFLRRSKAAPSESPSGGAPAAKEAEPATPGEPEAEAAPVTLEDEMTPVKGHEPSHASSGDPQAQEVHGEAIAFRLEAAAAHPEVLSAVTALRRWVQAVGPSQVDTLFASSALDILFSNMFVLEGARDALSVQALRVETAQLIGDALGQPAPAELLVAQLFRALELAWIAGTVPPEVAQSLGGRFAAAVAGLSSKRPDEVRIEEQLQLLGHQLELEEDLTSDPQNAVPRLFKRRDIQVEQLQLHRQLLDHANPSSQQGRKPDIIGSAQILRALAPPSIDGHTADKAVIMERTYAPMASEVSSCERTITELKTRQAELEAELEAVKQRIQGVEERKAFLQLTMEKSQASLEGFQSNAPAGPGLSTEQRQELEAMLNSLPAANSQGHTDGGLVLDGDGNRRLALYATCLAKYLNTETECAKMLSSRVEKNKAKMHGMEDEIATLESLGVKSLHKQQQSHLNEMKSCVEEDEHALRVMRQEATEAYGAFQRALAPAEGSAAGLAVDQLQMRYLPGLHSDTSFSIRHSAIALGIVRL